MRQDDNFHNHREFDLKQDWYSTCLPVQSFIQGFSTPVNHKLWGKAKDESNICESNWCATSILIRDLLLRYGNDKYITKLIHSIGEYFRYNKSVDNRMSLLSRLLLSPSRKYLANTLLKDIEAYQENLHIPDDSDVSIAFDNNQQHMKKGFHSTGKSDVETVHGVDLVEVLLPLECTSLSKTNQIEPKNLDTSFLQ